MRKIFFFIFFLFLPNIVNAQPGSPQVSFLEHLVDVNSATATAGRILAADGTDWESMAITGDCTFTGSGDMQCTGGASALIDLTDVNSATATAGRVLVTDGTDWESMQLTGDVTINTAGFIDLNADVVTTNEMSFINSATSTVGRIFVSDGTDFESMALTGDCTVNGAGYFDCSAGGDVFGPASSTDNAIARYHLTTGKIIQNSGVTIDDSDNMDIPGSLTVGSINIDGTNDTRIASAGETHFLFSSYSGNTLKIGDGNGTNYIQFDTSGNLTTSGTANLGSITNHSDINSATATAGRVFVSDGTDFDSVQLTGDATISAAGSIDLNAGVVGNNELSDFNSVTATAGRIFVADGTDFESMAIIGDCTMSGSGDLQCTGGASALVDLTDVNTATATSSNILVADGTDWESVAFTGDATISALGSLNLNAGVVGNNELSDFNSVTASAGQIFIADGTDFESISLRGAGQTLGTVNPIYVDTTDSQFVFYGGSSEKVIIPEYTQCHTLEDPVEADDNVPFFTAPEALTIVTTICNIDAGSVTATFQDAGDTTVDAPSCSVGNTTWDVSMSGTATLTKGEGLEFDTASPSGVGWMHLCIGYTVDRQ